MQLENNNQRFNESNMEVKKPWIFSGLEKLSIDQPSLFPTVGPDGGMIAPDCTHS